MIDEATWRRLESIVNKTCRQTGMHPDAMYVHADTYQKVSNGADGVYVSGIPLRCAGFVPSGEVYTVINESDPQTRRGCVHYLDNSKPMEMLPPNANWWMGKSMMDGYIADIQNNADSIFQQHCIEMVEAITTIRTIRTAIHAALLAEIGDDATADRLTIVIMRVIEGGR